MHRLLIEERASADPVAIDRPPLQTYVYRSVMCTVTEVAAILQQHEASYASQSSQALSTMALRTGPTSVGEDADHAEDVAAAGLLGQRLGEVAGLCLHLIEQPRVLDRDHGLVGEGLQQGDLLFVEGAHFLSPQQNGADTFVLAQQRHGKNASNPHEPERSDNSRLEVNSRASAANMSGTCTVARSMKARPDDQSRLIGHLSILMAIGP